MGVFGGLTRWGLQSAGLESFPEIPKAPPAPFVDPQTSQLDSIRGNYDALPDLQRTGRSVDKYNLSQRLQMLSQGFPGFTDVRDTGTNALLSQLRGEIPQDVGDELQRNANARAFAGGYGGSGMAGNLTARDFGRTSMDLINRGQSVAPGWIGAIGGMLPQQFDVTSGFLSPAQQISANQWNEENRFNRDWLQNQLDSLPDPAEAALAEGIGGIADIVGTAALAWAGGGIGAGLAGSAAGGMSAAQGGMLGSQLGGMIGGGGTAQGVDIGALVGGMWSPTPATQPAPAYANYSPYLSPIQTVNPLGSSYFDVGNLGGEYSYR